MGIEASGRYTERIILRGHAMTVDDGYEGGETKTEVRRMAKHESAKVRECEEGEGIGGEEIEARR